jgi:hypothetical protein
MMKTKIVTGIMLSLLLIGVTLAFNIQPVMVTSATAWDGVPDDLNPAQAIWIDPQNRTCGWGAVFVVDVLVNVTSITPYCGGLWGWEYRLWWNNTVLAVLKIDTHGDAKPSSDLLSGTTSVYVALNTTTDLGDGRDEHWYGVSALSGTTGFIGVASLCTYTFKCIGYPNGVSILDIRYTKLVDSCCLIPHTSLDGYVRVCMPDVNDDGIVDIHDIVTAALAFGSTSEDDPLTPWDETLNWNPDADLNNDGLVDIVDLVIIGVNFGKTL